VIPVTTISYHLPPEQEAIRANCFHPTGTFAEFKLQEVEQSIPERFEKIVQKYPDRLAVKTQDHALTYDQLNKAANRVARAILNRRNEREKLVALLFEPGSQVVVAMLGALKAGTIYVPLDPSFPRTRIIRILKDSDAKLIVTNSQNLALARESLEDEQCLLNIDDIDLSFPADNLGLSISPDAPAYVLYTSGSTGEPKGILHNHRNDLHDCMVYTNYLHFCASDRLTLLHSCSFSAARHNLFGALLNGGAIYPFDIKREGLTRLAD
jgi:non-ribosomal peptide synthetase component F